MSIRIISHCWAGDLPQYASFLHYQLSSLILHPPEIPVGITICYCKQDLETYAVLQKCLCHRLVKDFCLQCLELPKEELGRRCIGRNRAALCAREDAVWFADVDMCFGEGCLDAAYQCWQEAHEAGASMIYPRTILISRDHATGDAAVAEAVQSKERWLDLDPTQYEAKRYRKAIGGVQIVGGAFAREHGYLNGNQKWQQPRQDNRPFKDFRDDLIYRGFCWQFGPIVSVEVPQLFRLRHSRTSYQ